jgi:hypothetical protein
MAGGGCSLTPLVLKRNGSIMPVNHSRRVRVGAERCMASKRRRLSEVSEHGGVKSTDNNYFACLCSKKEKGDRLGLGHMGCS